LSENVKAESPESVQDRVLRVIATTRRVPLETVRPDSTFEELGIDSLDRINILFELEGEFDIEIDDEQAKQVTTLQQMIEGITLLLAAKRAKDGPGAASESPA
jgi:acyl carrier protein